MTTIRQLVEYIQNECAAGRLNLDSEVKDLAGSPIAAIVVAGKELQGDTVEINPHLAIFSAPPFPVKGVHK